MSPPDPDMLPRAIAAYEAGLCVVPPKQDGSKMPVAKRYVDEAGTERHGWKPWQQERSTLDEIRRWYALGTRTGLGFVCGEVSGGLELFEFDCRRTFEAFKGTAVELGMGELVERIEAGYSSETPGGGVHYLYRCATVAGNTKLARRPTRPEEMDDPDDVIRVLIETRGEGGYTVEAPSHGAVHPTGRAYRPLRGAVDTIVTITPNERRHLWALAETFDEMPDSAPTAPIETVPTGVRPTVTGLTVIGDFNARTTWREILEPHGWVLASEPGRMGYWRRPGKDGYWSATTNFGGGDRLCVFSSSTGFKTTDKQGSKAGYDRFGAYALLNHGDDAKAAVRELGGRGYGPKLPTLDVSDGWFAPPSRPSRHGRRPATVSTFNETDLAVARASLAAFAATPWPSPATMTAVADCPVLTRDVPVRVPVIDVAPMCPLCDGPGLPGGRACDLCMAT